MEALTFSHTDLISSLLTHSSIYIKNVFEMLSAFKGRPEEDFINDSLTELSRIVVVIWSPKIKTIVNCSCSYT